ncbi:MAG: TlpA disulfide reductase family protein [Burkholderiaceae bacterium]
MKTVSAIVMFVAMGLVGNACAATGGPPSDSPVSAPGVVAPSGGTSTPDGALPPPAAIGGSSQIQKDVATSATNDTIDAGPGAGLPAWQRITLTDAATGKTFTLADFAGKTVYVEAFATWCKTCRQQLGNVQQAQATLGSDVVIITLSVEPNIAEASLKKYAQDAGFDWTFAAMPPEMLQALADRFGQTISNPPATPHFIIRPDGSTTDLATGIEVPMELIGNIRAAQS